MLRAVPRGVCQQSNGAKVQTCQHVVYFYFGLFLKRAFTVLPRNQGPVLKSENTLFWLLVVLQFCSYLRTCASYGMHFVRTCQSQHKVSVCSRKSCTTVILFHFYQSAVSFFWFIFTLKHMSLNARKYGIIMISPSQCEVDSFLCEIDRCRTKLKVSTGERPLTSS